MRIYKNKKSEEYFIYIEPAGTGRAHLVLPEGKAAKPLNLSFFDEPEEGNENDFLSRGLITIRQIKRYNEEVNQRALFDEKERQAVLNQVFDDLPLKIKMEMIEVIGQAIQKMAPEKQKIVLEKLILN
ncbi:MAG: hypothetical protein U9N83_13700 [Thermodesulfobacteriota bacterium]|nr:hypothetical protein [Thermodesulfobacteriota bacterium]